MSYEARYVVPVELTLHEYYAAMEALEVYGQHTDGTAADLLEMAAYRLEQAWTLASKEIA
jgi:hypothetical protein